MVLLLALLIESAGPMKPIHLRANSLVEPMTVVAPGPRFSWELEGGGQGATQAAFRIAVSSGGKTIWDSGKVPSHKQSGVAYDGEPLLPATKYEWELEVWEAGEGSPSRARSTFGTGLFGEEGWEGSWLSDPYPIEAHRDPATLPALPVCYLRREFEVAPDLESATLFATALGAYSARLNGTPVGDHVLAPEWTDYTRRVMYQAYDVTGQLREGANAIGVVLGDGWYAGRLGMSQALHPEKLLRGVYGLRPKFLCQLVLRYKDGSLQTVSTGGDWRISMSGPVRTSDILDGEFYDGARQMPGWDSPGFEGKEWTRPKTTSIQSEATIVPQPNEPIRVVERLKPKAVTEPAPGVFVLDFGQNHAGFLRANFGGTPGSVIVLRHAEMLNEDGTVYTENLRGAPQVDRVVLPASRSVKAWQPSFTYHGYRYVQIEGLSTRPKPSDYVSLVFTSSAQEVSNFQCSDPGVEQLWSNILWTQRANLMGVPTDCPQRDERLGWTGDILAYGPTAMYRMDLAAFLAKWLQDMRDAQAKDGRYPDFAPHPYGPDERFSGAPGWGDAGVGCAWLLYQATGDKAVLEDHYDSMVRYLDWIESKNPGYTWANARHNDYGDWLNGNTLVRDGWDATGCEIPKEAFATLMWFRSAGQVASAAEVLGRRADAERFTSVAKEIGQAFREAFVAPDGRIQGDTQAGYAMALDFGILTEEQADAATRHLAESVRKRGGAHTTGFHSTRSLLRSLSRHGYNDLAYGILLRKDFPGWGYSIANGATTIWERWDGYVRGRGFQDPGMNSFSHYALGSVGEWIMETVVGIRAFRAPGRVDFHPQPGPGLTWASGTYRALGGLYACGWRREGEGVEVTVTVPPNQNASLTLPARAMAESGLKWSKDGRTAEVPAGTYTVRYRE